MNMTLPTYLKLVRFWNLPENEQVKHLLFFITVVVELRKDMTATIIHHRLNDQGLSISEDRVRQILETYTQHFQLSTEGDQRDRKEGEEAYKITDGERRRLTASANLRWAKYHWWGNKDVFLVLSFIWVMTTAVFCVGIWECVSAGANCLDWQGYKQKVSVDASTGPEKSKYFLYYVTRHEKFRQDMTPEVISDRLKDAGLGVLPARDIQSYFNSKPMEVVPSEARKGAYMISDAEASKISEMLEVKFYDQATISWVIKYLPLAIIFGFLTVFGGLVGSAYIWGRNRGREAKINEDILHVETK